MKKFTLFFTFSLSIVFGVLNSFSQDQPVNPTLISTGTFWGETPPLSSLPVLSESDWQALNEKFKTKVLNPKTGERPYPFQSTSLPTGPDEAWQKEMGSKGTLALIMNFAGQGSNAYPTDPNGDVNQNYYFQTINSIYSIYTKAGALVAGPTNINLLFGSVPGSNCNDGDPIVLWDEAAGRWMVAEFSLCNADDRMLVAVSTTSNPTGTWYQYSFNVADVPDYEKFGVWRDAYYMGTNTGSGNDIYAFQRDVMLAGGASPIMVAFDNAWRPASGFHCVPPADNDGTLAPAGTPGYFITINNDAWGGSDELWIYQLVVNWTTPASSTFTRTQQLAVTAFDNNFGAGWDNITQQGTTQKLDAVLEVLMQRPQYRNFGTYQTIVCCHTVDVNNTDRAGIRWYELRRTTGNWSIRQTGTYSPDAHSRWMGSIALNGNNQIGLGYSISSLSLYPGIRYCAQSASAYATGAGVMDIAEGTIQTGSASQSGSNRWGDYTMLAVDPSDNQTFWYTNQYYVATSPVHPTRIASFNFDPYCAASGGCYEYISRVQIGTIDNVSTCSSYSNYTSISDNFPLNAVKYLTVTNGSAYASDQCGVWIDWNKDNDFYDANEAISVVGTPGYGPYTASITPPVGTTTGAVRMRIRITYTGAVDPCGNTTYGEVEDYTLNITAASTSNTWLGITSTDWYTGSNWSLGLPPTSTTSASITAGTPFSPVIGTGNAYCMSLYLHTGATLTQNTSSYFYCYGTFDAGFGQFTMSGTSYLYLDGAGNSYWYDDNQNDTYTGVRVDKSLNTAIVSMPYNMTCSGTFEIREGVLAISPGRILNVTNTTSAAFEVEDGGKLILDSSTEGIDCDGSVRFFDGSQATLSNGFINCAGNFTVDANTSYNIAFTGGALVMNGSSTQYINDLDGGNLDLYNLTIAKTGGVCYIQSANLDVNGAVLISGGALSANNAPTPTASYNIKVGSNWTNTVGAGGFVPGTGTVVFHSLTGAAQDAEGINTFYNVLQDNTGQYLRFNLSNGNTTIQNNLELHHYSWAYRSFIINGILNIDDANSRFTSNGPDGIAIIASLNQGGRLISNGGGSVTVNDLVESGLFGSYYVNGSTDYMQITNSGTGTFVDLGADLHILGGTMKISGNVSWWPYNHDAVVEMTGGILDLTGCGIYIYNTATYALNDIISGGTIRTIGGFSGNRADFTPTAGTFEFYGPTDATISQSNGCTLYNVNINKAAKDGFISKPELTESVERIDETWGKGGKANSISMGSNFTITNNLTVTAGSFKPNGFQANVNNICDVYGSLVMTNSTDKLYVGTGSYDNLTFYNGSNSTLTAGAIYPASWVWSQAGATITGTNGNTIYFTGTNTTGIEVDGPGSVFGNVDINKSGGVMYLFCNASPAELAGYFNIHAGNSIQMQGSSMIVHGIATDNATSAIHLDYADKGSNPEIITAGNESISSVSGAKGGSLIIDTDLTINGLWNVLSGNVLVHGLFNVAASGTLTITTGSLICDAPSTSVAYVAGNFNLGEGVYEIRNNSLNMYPVTSSITGGIIKAGGTFIANMVDRFKPGFGTVELINGVNGHYIQMHSTNYFNHLIVNRAYPIGIYSGTSLTVKKDLTINAGGLNSNSLPIYLGGNWNENMGPSGFTEGTGTVFFNGTGVVNHQNINGTETFYNIENAKTGGGELRPNGITLVSNNYLANGFNIVTGTNLDVQNTLNLSTGTLGLSASAPNVGVNNFTMGGVLSVTDGNFTCMDVTNNGIYGTITLTNGSIILNQDAGQYPDLNANVTINGGYMAINGGSSGCVWGWGSPCIITMTNGVLDFNNNGIYINSSNSVTESITGGTIKTNQQFSCTNTNFTPTGGITELYGITDTYIRTLNNSNLFNLLINKPGGDKGMSPVNEVNTTKSVENDYSLQFPTELQSGKNNDRPKMASGSTKLNQIATFGVLKVNGTITVEEGTFLIDNDTATCMGDINVNAGGKLAIGDYGTLAVGNGKILSVNNGGILDLTGSVGGAATITHNTGYYALKVLSGGTIGAVYGIFEYMDLYGIYLYPGSLIDPVNSFNNCTFRYQNPVASSSLFTIGGTQVFTASNASFPVNTGAGTYNVWKYDNAGDITFFNASGSFAGPEFEYDPYSHVQWTMTPYTVGLTVFLEGPFNTSTNLMNTSINTLLPLGQPYGTPPPGNPTPDWLYTGTEIVPAIPSASIVDWVEVQLRDATTAAGALPARVIARKVGFLLNNGVVVGLDGLNPLSFNSYFGHNLYAVVWHRNHLGVLSANSLTPVGGGYSYNFSTGPGQAYTTGIPAQKLLAAGIYGMKSGDGTGNGLVETTDKTAVWSAQAGKTGYREGDYNMNRQVNNPDKDDKWLPNLGNGSFIPE